MRLHVNFTLRLLAALLLFSGSMAAQTDMFVASDDTPVLSVNDLAVDPETGDQYMLMTLSDSGADAQEPLHFQAPDGTELSSGFTWTPQGGRDACLARVTADGDFLWACAIGSTLDDELFGIALDGEGNLAVTGYVQGDLEIQEGSGSITQIDLDEANNQDCFTALFTTDGDLMWYRVDGGSGSDLGRKIDFCGSGWGVLGAFEAGDAVVGGQLLTPDTPDQSDFFLLQTDQAGEPVWTTHWGSDLPDFNTYRYIWNNLGLSFVDDRWFAAFPWNDTACAFYDSSGQPFDGVALTSPYSGLNQGVVCVNSNGFYNWSQSIVSSDDAIHGMCLVANTDGVYVAGTSPGFYVGDVADFTAYHSAPSVDDPYVLKLNFWDGSEMFCSWVDFGTPDQSGVAKTVALAQSEDGSLTLAGYTGADYNEPVIVAETLVADYDAFMASMDALGTVTSVWVSERTGPDGIVALSSTSFGVAAVGASASTIEESTGSLGMFSFASTCSTPPSAGTIVQNSFAVCSGQSITLASTGTLGDLKWQKKVMSGNWVDLPLATTSTFEYTPSSSTSFRLEASNPGCLISYSEEIEVTLQAVVFATVSCPPSPQQEEADPCTYFYEVQDYTSGITLGACSTGSITQTPAAGSLVSVGSHTVTLEHSDGATVSNCSFTLEVSGPSAGVVSLADQAVGLGASCTYTMENFSDLATVSGGCAGDTWDIYHAFTGDAMPGQTLMAGTYTIHFEALGSGGGFAFGAFELTVVDQSAPEFDVLVDDMLVLVADDCTAPKPDVVSLLDAFDCSGVWYDATYVNTVSGETVLDSETTLEIGAYEVHLTFSDALANAVDYAFDLKVVDGDGPELVQLQTEITAACMYAVPNWVSAGVIDASDACSSFSITGQSPAQGTFLVAPYDLSNCAVIAEDAFGNETVFPFSLGVDVQDVPRFRTCHQRLKFRQQAWVVRALCQT